MLVGESVEHARGDDALACFVCVLDAGVLEVDEDLVGIVDAAKTGWTCAFSRARGWPWSNIGRHRAEVTFCY